MDDVAGLGMNVLVISAVVSWLREFIVISLCLSS
jgi:hypothetical protein